MQGVKALAAEIIALAMADRRNAIRAVAKGARIEPCYRNLSSPKQLWRRMQAYRKRLKQDDEHPKTKARVLRTIANAEEQLAKQKRYIRETRKLLRNAGKPKWNGIKLVSGIPEQKKLREKLFSY